MVLSEATKSRPHPAVLAWLETVEADELYCSAVSFAEFERGACAIEAKEPARARRFRSWIEGMIRDYSGRILDVDIPAARAWGRLSVRLLRRDEDIMIGATALLHRCILVTRNVRDFRHMDLNLINPYASGES